MQITFAKILALLITLAYAAIFVVSAVAGTHSTAEAVVRSCEGCLVLMVPLALILFPEQIGAATGYIGHSVIDAESPPVIVSAMGWIFLVAIPVAACLIR